jgi:hypothetical protein
MGKVQVIESRLKLYQANFPFRAPDERPQFP